MAIRSGFTVRLVNVVAYPQRLFVPGGLVQRWNASMSREVQRQTVRAAPLNKRTRKNPGNPPRGALRKGIHSSASASPASLSTSITVQSDAPYSKYVHDGTKTIIVRDRRTGRFASGRMSLPGNNFGPPRKVHRVSGQAANPFLLKGLARASAKHPSLRGAAGMMRNAGL